MKKDSGSIKSLLFLGCLMTHANVSAFTITSSDFTNGAPIDRQFTGQGSNKIPRLQWEDAPTGTKSFILIADDPDAPGQKEPWVHWVVYNIPASATNLDYIKDRTAALANGTLQGMNSWPKIGYDGPMPPAGNAHRYFFTLYALDTILPLKSGATKDEILKAAKSHILGKAQIMGLYKRL
jgi:Raf kinase inhibitor-like YbhB/YbcL family protein